VLDGINGIKILLDSYRDFSLLKEFQGPEPAIQSSASQPLMDQSNNLFTSFDRRWLVNSPFFKNLPGNATFANDFRKITKYAANNYRKIRYLITHI